MTAPAHHLIVGLGNPGSTYESHRHNLGFMVADELAGRLGLTFQRVGSKYDFARGEIPSCTLVLLKPLTYMNLSGQAVAAWSRDAGITVTGEAPETKAAAEPGSDPAVPTPAAPDTRVRPLVVCDDLNLPLGSVRLRPRGSSGGQNGLASVIEYLGGDDFPRLRLGVAPLDRDIDPAEWPDHVLSNFAPTEAEIAADMVSHAAAALEFWLENGLDPAISRFNRRIRPPQERCE